MAADGLAMEETRASAAIISSCRPIRLKFLFNTHEIWDGIFLVIHPPCWFFSLSRSSSAKRIEWIVLCSAVSYHSNQSRSNVINEAERQNTEWLGIVNSSLADLGVGGGKGCGWWGLGAETYRQTSNNTANIHSTAYSYRSFWVHSLICVLWMSLSPHTKRCLNAVDFLPNPDNRHPIARPWRREMGCLLWFWYLIHVLPAAVIAVSYVILW